MVVPQAKIGQDNSSGAATQVRGPCYNFNQSGHFTRYCPFPLKQKGLYPARVHHITIYDIYEGEPMTAGIFSINNHPAVVLFDSGSSHSFISQVFARKHEKR
jgi:hypothetical protein